jgi:hypothetical protein
VDVLQARWAVACDEQRWTRAKRDMLRQMHAVSLVVGKRSGHTPATLCSLTLDRISRMTDDDCEAHSVHFDKLAERYM